VFVIGNKILRRIFGTKRDETVVKKEKIALREAPGFILFVK